MNYVVSYGVKYISPQFIFEAVKHLEFGLSVARNAKVLHISWKAHQFSVAFVCCERFHIPNSCANKTIFILVKIRQKVFLFRYFPNIECE